MKFKNAHGFTIVEILIVIVVIAMLASISVVAYSGITRRAQNAQIATAVSSWEKILISYKAQVGDYYTVASGCQPLLGKSAADFTDLGGCTAAFDATLISNLSSVTGATIPNGRLPDFGATNLQGVRYVGTGSPYYLEFNYSDNGCPRANDIVLLYSSSLNVTRCRRQLP